jgi:hypothetical protein
MTTVTNELLYVETIKDDGCYTHIRLDATWDGCVHIGAYRDGERDGYLHICDFDAYIARLVEFRNKAAKHFQSAEWPASTLSLTVTHSPQSSPGRSTEEQRPSEP